MPLACKGLFRKGWSMQMDEPVSYAKFRTASTAERMLFTSGAYSRDGPNKTGSLRGLLNDIGLMRRRTGDTIAFGTFTFDATEMPHGNSRQLIKSNVRIETLIGEMGQALLDGFGTG